MQTEGTVREYVCVCVQEREGYRESEREREGYRERESLKQLLSLAVTHA